MIDLKRIKTEYPESFESAGKLRAYLSDLCPGEKARTNVLTAMLSEGVADIVAQRDDLSAGNFRRKISDDYGFKAELVAECYDMYVVAFGYAVKAVDKEQKSNQALPLKPSKQNGTQPSAASGLLKVVPPPLTGTLRRFEIDNGLLVKYGGRKYNVVVPSGVYTVGAKVFYRRKSIRALTLPKSVSVIEQSAFKGCENLASVEIRGATLIKKYAFAECVNLTDVTLPNTLTELGSGVFGGCTGLRQVFIPSSVKFVGHMTFAMCKRLKIYCEATSKPRGWKDDWCPSNCKVIWGSSPPVTSKSVKKSVAKAQTNTATGKSGATVTKRRKITVINTPKPSQQIKITVNSSSTSTSKTKIVINGSTEFDIRSGVLVKYTGVQSSVSIPDGVTEIGESAFAKNRYLVSVAMPHSVKIIGNNAFAGCVRLKNVVFSDGLTNIGSYAFDGCESLVNVVIPANVRNIGSFAFADCKDLTNLLIPYRMETLGWKCFSMCKKLKNVTMQGGKRIEDGVFEGCEQLNNILLPPYVQYIGADAFAGCVRMPVIILPLSVATIGANAFKGCKRLLIGCRVGAKPAGWSNDWNVGNCHVAWKYRS